MLRASHRLLVGACLVALVFFAALSGCQSLGELAAEFDPRQKPPQVAYEADIAPFLAKGQIYSGPATVLLARALPLNRPVREAMVRRQAAARAAGPSEAARLQAGQEAQAKRWAQVALSLYVPETDWNDLTDPEPTWRVWLTSPDGRVRLAPADIRRVRDRSAINEALFPFWGPWSRLYLIKFPRADAAGRPAWDAGGQARLLIAGAPGRTVIDIRIAPPADN